MSGTCDRNCGHTGVVRGDEDAAQQLEWWGGAVVNLHGLDTLGIQPPYLSSGLIEVPFELADGHRYLLLRNPLGVGVAAGQLLLGQPLCGLHHSHLGSSSLGVHSGAAEGAIAGDRLGSVVHVSVIFLPESGANLLSSGYGRRPLHCLRESVVGPGFERWERPGNRR